VGITDDVRDTIVHATETFGRAYANMAECYYEEHVAEDEPAQWGTWIHPVITFDVPLRRIDFNGDFIQRTRAEFDWNVDEEELVVS
jgi:hypothetical protein